MNHVWRIDWKHEDGMLRFKLLQLWSFQQRFIVGYSQLWLPLAPNFSCSFNIVHCVYRNFSEWIDIRNNKWTRHWIDWNYEDSMLRFKLLKLWSFKQRFIVEYLQLFSPLVPNFPCSFNNIRNNKWPRHEMYWKHEDGMLHFKLLQLWSFKQRFIVEYFQLWPPLAPNFSCSFNSYSEWKIFGITNKPHMEYIGSMRIVCFAWQTPRKTPRKTPQ